MTDILDDLLRRRLLHMRLVKACDRVIAAGDLTVQAVRSGMGLHAQFNVYANTAELVVDASKLIGLAHARWQGFAEPPELVAAIDEVLDAIDELPAG